MMRLHRMHVAALGMASRNLLETVWRYSTQDADVALGTAAPKERLISIEIPRCIANLVDLSVPGG